MSSAKTLTVKRKSFDNDENENTSNKKNEPETNCNKKLKTSTSSKNDASELSNAVSKTALPRFTRKVSTSIIPKVVKSNTIIVNREKLTENNANSSTNAAMKTPPRSVLSPKRPQTASKQNPLTVQTPRISANPFLKKMQREIMNEMTGNFFNTLFETHITTFQLEDRLSSILGGLKIKAKWDIKEKAKKQEQVIKELRDLLVNLQDTIHSFKSQGVSFEEKLVNSVRDCYDHVVDNMQTLSALQSNDKKLRSELESMLAEKNSLFQKLDDSKQNFLSQLKQLETSQLLTNKENERLAEKLEELHATSEKAKAQYEETIQELKANREKHIEDVMKVYLMELTTLKSSHGTLQQQFEKSQQDYTDLNQQFNITSSALQKKSTEEHDVSVQHEVLIRENSRLTEEIKSLKEAVKEKEDDMRKNMTSHYDMLKQSMDEKNALWSELSQANAKLNVTEEERRTLTTQLSDQKEEISLLHRDVCSLKEQKVTLETQISVLEEQSNNSRELLIQLETEKNLKSYFEAQNEQEKRERIAATAQHLAIQNELQKKLQDVENRLTVCLTENESNVNSLQNEKCSLVEKSKEQEETIHGLKEEISSLHVVLKEKQQFAEKFQGISVESARNLDSMLAEKEKQYIAAVEELSFCKGELEKLRSKLTDSLSSSELTKQEEKKKMQDFEDKLQVSEQMRRKLFNVIQELRGNIRVFARVRPFLPGDYSSGDSQSYPESAISPRSDLNTLKIKRCANSENKKDKDENYDFSFDRVFGPAIGQQELFQEVGEFVQSALDGYQVCLFSYGQTGSGKTHTMNGSGDGDMRGIIPRAMEQVALYKKELQQKGWRYSMEISFIEIYNENIRDLLRTLSRTSDGSIVNSSNFGSANQASFDVKHEIKKDANGNYCVTDVNKLAVDPDDLEAIAKILEVAATQRSVSSTLMNDTSSRSHAVFTLHLRAVNTIQQIELNGSLNLVDLAGSERLDRSGVTGQELKEAVAINKSLSSLADVFSAIANKSSHIPFRNSKLTYLLQPALSGDGKTLMIVNLSPTEASFHESLSSLRFANQVSQCELGKPKRKLKELTSACNVSTAEDSGLCKTASLALPTPSPMGNLNMDQAKSLSHSLGAKTPTSSSMSTSSKSVVKSSASNAIGGKPKATSALNNGSRSLKQTTAPKTPMK